MVWREPGLLVPLGQKIFLKDPFAISSAGHSLVTDNFFLFWQAFSYPNQPEKSLFSTLFFTFFHALFTFFCTLFSERNLSAERRSYALCFERRCFGWSTNLARPDVYDIMKQCFLGGVYCGFAGDKYLNISVMACFRYHSNIIKVVRNCLFHIMKLLLQTPERKNIAQNLVKIRKCHPSKNKTTFFTYF